MRIAKLVALAGFLGALAAPGMASAYDYCYHLHSWHARQHCEWQRHHNNYGYDHHHDHDHDNDHNDYHHY